MDVIYTKGTFTNIFPDAAFSTDKDKFSFSISMRIENFNPVNHSIAGVIDSMKIYSIADTTKKITIKNAGFNFYFDFLELFLNDTLMYETATGPYSNWFPRNFGGEENIAGVSGERLYPTIKNPPFKMGQLSFGFSFIQVQEVFQRETILPLSSDGSNFSFRPEEYLEINGRPFAGISPGTTYECRFINSTQIGIAGGVEVTTGNAKQLLDEYYDYVADPVSGVYHPQEFMNAPNYKLRCMFYQRKF